MTGGADGVLVADDHGAAEGLEDIFIGGAAGGKHTGVEHVHVGGRNVLHGDDAFCWSRMISHALRRLVEPGMPGISR